MERGDLKKLLITLSIFVILQCLLFFTFKESKQTEKHLPIQIEHRDILASVTRHVNLAHSNAKNPVTRQYIKKAYDLLSTLLETEDEKDQMLRSQIQKDVCPEKFRGQSADYPFFFRNFVTDSCKNARPIEKVLSWAFIASHCAHAKTVFQGIQQVYNSTKVFVAVKDASCKDLPKSPKLIQVPLSKKGLGQTWIDLVAKADSKYVLVARDLVFFDWLADVRRLIRIAGETGAAAVSGSRRFKDGRWLRSCYQTGMKNYTLKFVDGYHFSHKSCAYCDHLDAPFLIKPKDFKAAADPKLQEDAFFADLFLSLSQRGVQLLSCPDVMFHTEAPTLDEVSKTSWQQLAVKKELNRILVPGRQHAFTCAEAKITCSKASGIILPICCVEELTRMLKVLHRFTEKHKVHYAIAEGTLIGAIKFNKVLPWERDADLDWLAMEKTTYQKNKEEFTPHGFKLVETDVNNKWKMSNYDTCIKEVTTCCCAYFAYRGPNWRIEMWGEMITAEQMYNLTKGYENQTRIYFDGDWLLTYPNPALAMRNHYKDDLLAHVEHWSDQRKSSGFGEILYAKRNSFIKCPRPGFHGCMDQYLTEGSIQFMDFLV